MPYGTGTYGKKVGRPSKALKRKLKKKVGKKYGLRKKVAKK